MIENSPDVQLILWSEIAAIVQGACTLQSTSRNAESTTTPESVMVYVYTGGTTKASKCVAVTHAMALWEAENYSLVLGPDAGNTDKMLQYSSVYWGAAVFGQI